MPAVAVAAVAVVINSQSSLIHNKRWQQPTATPALPAPAVCAGAGRDPPVPRGHGGGGPEAGEHRWRDRQDQDHGACCIRHDGARGRHTKAAGENPQHCSGTARVRRQAHSMLAQLVRDGTSQHAGTAREAAGAQHSTVQHARPARERQQAHSTAHEEAHIQQSMIVLRQRVRVCATHC